MEINSNDQCKANFRILKLADPSINFEAEALPRSGGFKLRWTKEGKRNLKDCEGYRIRIEKVDDESQKGLIFTLKSKIYKWDIKKWVDPDKRYTTNISLHFLRNWQIVEEPFAEFQLLNCQSYISELQYKNLFLKAKKFCVRKGMTPFTHFYRAEMEENWKKYTPNFVDFKSGKCKLKPHKKRLDQGHRVPGMDRIPGVSFFARRNSLPDFSPFGDTFVDIPIECLMQDPLDYEFFFMDIKCYENESGLERTHYIIIIIAKKESQEEKYCRKRMGDPLDKINNPFLRIEKDDSEKFTFFMPSDFKCYLEAFFVQQTGFITFDWERVENFDTVKSGKRKVPYEDCSICSLLKPVEDIPSSSFPNQNPSYPSTPESEENDQISNIESIRAEEDDSEEMHSLSSSMQNQTLSPKKRQNSSPNPNSMARKQINLNEI